ncbi:hypothetical protein [Aquimarina atlantica]|uniref:hypothetical protein n=1 Tax=Aquimarina atlantica TaxID=1317122 RepID=UPI000A6ED29B|nr:hypothetical protein [Aquimarina atlantica]
MFNNILDLKGAIQLSKNEQQTIKAGTYYGDQCLRLCSGHCSFGRCFEQLD